jgi:hypothetical protein
MRGHVTRLGLLGLVVFAAGCGGGNHATRDAIAAYVTKINAVEVQLARPLVDVSKANRDFARGKGNPAKIQARLARSEQIFARLRRRIAAVTPPPEAKRMRLLLLELVDRQADLAHETLLLARFVPAFSAALRPLPAEGRSLRSALNAKQPANAKADALELYGRQLGAVLPQLRALHPPPASAPAVANQVRTLVAVRASVVALARAVREKRAKQVAPLLHRFDVAASSNRSLAAQRAQIAAVRAYNARVRAIDRIVGQLSAERLHLLKLAG